MTQEHTAGALGRCVPSGMSGEGPCDHLAAALRGVAGQRDLTTLLRAVKQASGQPRRVCAPHGHLAWTPAPPRRLGPPAATAASCSSADGLSLEPGSSILLTLSPPI